ncbi:FG-GAP-like repeat-containing protein [Sphingobacterium siyangense]|uniref:FG-GAP-like repeat-containing protein n=1 Tax=Sphingobacterium siyangense TaxID=459529 RepID=UPI0031FA1E40
MKRLIFLLSLFCAITIDCISQNRIQTDTLGLNKSNSSNLNLLESIIKVNATFPSKFSIDTLKTIVSDSSSSIKVSKSGLQTLAATLSPGRTEVNLDVSATGSTNYTIPFIIPPGIDGFVPELGLIYNSQSSRGTAGYGWSVFGLSSISRVGAAKYSDDRVGGVNFDLKDRFSLDGQRLLLKSGSYGGDGAEYQTEQYSNIKIVSRGVSSFGASFGPAYFEVFYPNGTKAFYGQNANSSSRLQYGLTYMENSQGVRISYEYTTFNNNLFISKVLYGSRGTGTALNRIEFSYGAASRAEQNYVAGTGFYSDKKISKISIVANGTNYRHYIPTYSTVSTLDYDRMTEIQEFDGSELNAFAPIRFEYDNTTNMMTSQVISNLSLTGIASNNSKVISGDFTGNGSMDFLLYPKVGLQSPNKFYAFYDLDPGSPYMQLGYEVNTGYFIDIFPATWLSHENKILPGQGMLLLKNNGANSYKFDMYSSGTVVPVYYQYSKSIDGLPLAGGYYSECDRQDHEGVPNNFEFVSGDFNGDGLTDVIMIGRNQQVIVDEYRDPGGDPPCVKVYGNSGSVVVFVNMDRRTPSGWNQVGMMYSFLDYGDKLYTADFNGDGKTDILHVKSGSMFVYTLNDNNYFELLWQTSDPRITTNPDKPILLGDFNGDGKMDVMFATGYSNLFATFMCTGKGFIKHEKNEPFTHTQNTWDGSNTMKQYVLVPTDVNGDGKTDIIFSATTTYNSTATGNIAVTIYHNTGMDISNRPVYGNSVSSNRSTTVRHNPIPIFLNPDQQNPNLEYGYISDNSISLFRSDKDMMKEGHLTTIFHDGVNHYIDYARLMEGANGNGLPLYNSSYDQTFPYIDIHFAPQLYVTSAIARDAAGQIGLQTFGYANAVTNADGLGFLGFGENIRSNVHTGASDVNRTYTIGIQSPQLRGANLRTFVSKNSYINNSIKNMAVSNPPPAGGAPDGATLSDYISREDHIYQTSILTNKTFINVPIAFSLKDKLLGTYRNQRFTYDGYYNVTYHKTDVNGQGSERSAQTYENSTGTTYYIGRLTDRKDTTQVGTEIYTAEKQLVYTGYLPTQVKSKGHNTSFITQALTYDAFGNITKRITTTPADGSRTETMVYEATGRFKTKYTDPDGLFESFVNSSVSGMLTSYTDKYNRNTAYTFDSWNRIKTTIDYLGKVKTNTYTKDMFNTIITATGDDGSSSISTIDQLGKKIEQRDKTVLGTFEGRSWKYDVYGREYQVSELSQPGSYTLWNTLSFDSYGRIYQSTKYTGRVQTYSYSGLNMTVNDGVKSVTTSRNAFDMVTSLQDPGGTVTYTYFANGNLKTADFGGSIQTIEQDGWGQKTKLIDPSAGTYQYTYDGWGQVKQETSPLGQSQFVYDQAGKLSTRNFTGTGTNMQWTYTYDPTSKLLAQVALVNGDGNNSTDAYVYDTYKRLSSQTEDNSYAQFSRTFLYDAFGRVNNTKVKATHKPTSTSVEKSVLTQYQNGLRQQLNLPVTPDGGHILWRVDSLSLRGELTAATQGVSRTSLKYDTYGFPQQRRLYRTSGTPATLMTLGTTFNVQREFPTSRTNSAFSWSESFGYDNLDRLTTFNDNNGSQSQQYDARGRITQNTRQGTYSYSGVSYKQQDLTLNTSASAYYQTRTPQDVSFNAFKSPIEISETGIDRISFQYNSSLGRANMFYGGVQADKMLRRFRKHYAGDGSSEIIHDTQTGQVSFILYLGGDAYSAPAIWKESKGSLPVAGALYYLHRDYLGSIVMITNQSGGIVEKRQFDAWGNIVKLTDGSNNNLTTFAILDRGFTGHEHLLSVGLINMNGRLYDGRMARFLSPDGNVQDPFNTQNYNRFAYALNNPLIYVDPNGEVLFGIPILAGIIWGAIIGAGVGAAAYSINAAITGDWSWSGFGSSLAMGAIGGAIGGGVSAIGSSGLLGSFGNTFGYNMLSQTVSSVVTTSMYGGEINLASVAGMVAGGLVGSAIPKFNPIKGSGFGTGVKNSLLELSYSAGKGALTGATSGAVQKVLGNADKNIILNSAIGGAIGGFSNTLFNIGVMGPAMSFDDSYIPHGNDRPIHRGGGLADWLNGTGVSLGRNAYGNNLNDPRYRVQVGMEESFHYLQQKQMGFANFYGRIISEALKFGTQGVYDTRGTLEYQASHVAMDYILNKPYNPSPLK